MRTSLFDFTLPESLVAVHPVSPRDASRMLVVECGLCDAAIRDFPSFLKPGDVAVFNDTRVIPARLVGKRGLATVEILLHKQLSAQPLRWQAFAKPARRLTVGDTIGFADDFSAVIVEKLPSGEIVLAFGESLAEFHSKLARHGRMPLPPYIRKMRMDDIADEQQYQTVFAAREGAVAAPTAGLHFTPALLAAVDAAGASRAYVTLHVGGGTFLPVKAEDTSQHVMHSEYAEITVETAATINRAKAAGARVVAIGTTSLRTLESAADACGVVHPFRGETDLFITPGYRFRATDVLLTNFHLPRSTLFMLVSAFSGLERMQAAYAHAIAERYRFYSYGDACLLFRQAACDMPRSLLRKP